jgi:hypothetical protein
MDSSIPRPVGWQGASRRVSSCDSQCSLPAPSPSNEQYELMNFAYRLTSIVKNSDPSTVDNIDVRREAMLLMSLSYPSWEDIHEETEATTTPGTNSSGRITPPSSSDATTSSASSTTSTNTGGSRRDSFCFTCPSLSLGNEIEGGTTVTTRGREIGTNNDDSVSPVALLGRTLWVGDRDAIRLSSDAMARNVIQSFQKAMQLRIQSWISSLARYLVMKEGELKSSGATGGTIEELLRSHEALLTVVLRKISSKIQVLEASTCFKVMHKLPTLSDSLDAPASKKPRFENDDRVGLQEGEYVYDVTHVLEMQTALKVSTPAGNVHIDLNVPGVMSGTFLSSEQNCDEELTAVNLQLNTGMLATMIDKGSRIAVRASAEAVLTGQYSVEANPTFKDEARTEVVARADEENLADSPAPATITERAAQTTTPTPKRKFMDNVNPVSGIVVITPRDAPSPSSYGESDSDGDISTEKPVRLQIPDNFSYTKNGGVIYPQPSRARDLSSLASFAARLPPKKTLHTTAVVTPLKMSSARYEYREKGPNLPVLVEVACAAMDATI